MRLFAPELAAAGDHVDLPADEAHHARNVMRLRVGATVELFDGAGRVASGAVTEISRGRVRVAVRCTHGPIARPQPCVELAFAVPRGKRLDMLLEKATELGVVSLQPIVFQRSVAGGERLSPGKRQRWLAHCIAAAKQCRLNFLPDIHAPEPLDDYVASCRCDRKLVGDVAETAQPLAQALAGWLRTETICLLIGPEGDLNPDEWPMVKQGGFVGVRLGHTTLRVETAAIALLAGVTAICDGMAV